MALDNLRAFIGAIDDLGDLVRVEQPVSVDKEITEIADRCMKSTGGGPALVFAVHQRHVDEGSIAPLDRFLIASEQIAIRPLDHIRSVRGESGRRGAPSAVLRWRGRGHAVVVSAANKIWLATKDLEEILGMRVDGGREMGTIDRR